MLVYCAAPLTLTVVLLLRARVGREHLISALILQNADGPVQALL